MDKQQLSDRPGSSNPASTAAVATSNATSTATSRPNASSPTIVPSPSPRRAQESQQQQALTQTSDSLYPHQIHGLGGPTATAPFLRDFSLVAEAASRAQMSLVTRDLEGVSL